MTDNALASVAGGTAQGLVVFLIELITREVKLLSEVHEVISKISSELQIVGSFLENDATRGKSPDASKVWKAQVRDAAYDGQDVIDEFMYFKAKTPPKLFIGARKGMYELIKAGERHRIADPANRILTKFRGISDNAERYGLRRADSGESSRSNHVHERRRAEAERSAFPSNEDHCPVGIEGQVDRLVSWLVEEADPDLIAVKGMGGLGKTTLVGNAYCRVKDEFKGEFDYYAWVPVSQEDKASDILRRLIKELMDRPSHPRLDHHGAEYIDLAKELQTLLGTGRYLVVLDDVWDPDLWRDIEFALPHNGRRSRVIVTTRKDVVVSSLGGKARVFPVQLLSFQHARELFCKVAFRDSACPQVMVKMVEAIVTKCDGLPLAIVAMAELMRSRASATQLEWKKTGESLGWHLTSNKKLQTAKEMLLLSFNELPYQLKHCFLYFSTFPENYAVKKRRLIRLWMAEGFVIVEEHDGGAPEDRAESYLEELVSRNLIQAAEKPHERPKTYRMHNVMRELAVLVAKQEKFLSVFNGNQAKPCCQARRLSIHKRCENISNCSGESRLCSIFSFDKSSSLLDSMRGIWSHFKLVKVLDLEGSRIQCVPDGLIELFNLTYLNLRRTGVTDVPKGLKRLLNLETLDLRDTRLDKLSFKIESLQKLRHLLVRALGDSGKVMSTMGVSAPKGLCQLKTLQTLSYVRADESVVMNVGSLTQLKKLGITHVKEDDGASLCCSIKKMKNLRHLSIAAADKEVLNLNELSPPPRFIQKLVLLGHLRQLPSWIVHLEDLSHLCLRSSHLTQDPLPSLQYLPHLEELELCDAYVGKQLVFRAGSFRALRYLRLWDLCNLEEVHIEIGGLVCIRQFQLVNCKQMKMVPTGMEYMHQFSLDVADMSADFGASMTCPP